MFLKRNRPAPENHFDFVPSPDVEIPVTHEWDELVQRADEMAAVIDQHLEYESALQGRDLTVATLCPEQKASLVSDLWQIGH